MKKYITLLLLSMISISVAAQGFVTTPRSGLVKDDSGYTFSYPSTVIEVEVLIEKEVVTPGIYARYAQKYLATRTPLVEQISYRVVDARICLSTDISNSTPFVPAAPKVEYSKLQADQYSSIVLNDDDAAREAAAAIFTIRRQRREIVDGEAGEGYFGAGLEAAMARLDAMEQEYLDLFMGYRTTTQSTHRYLIKPQAETYRSVLARFDNKSGILPANDLTGAPIYIQFRPYDIPDTSSYGRTERTRATTWLRISPPTDCILYNDSEQIASAILTIYEFGKDVEIETLAK